jgi:hypothetical protein
MTPFSALYNQQQPLILDQSVVDRSLTDLFQMESNQQTLQISLDTNQNIMMDLFTSSSTHQSLKKNPVLNQNLIDSSLVDLFLSIQDTLLIQSVADKSLVDLLKPNANLNSTLNPTFIDQSYPNQHSLQNIYQLNLNQHSAQKIQSPNLNEQGESFDDLFETSSNGSINKVNKIRPRYG